MNLIKTNRMADCELYTLASLIKSYPPNIILESGTGLGGATSYMANQLNLNGFGTIKTYETHLPFLNQAKLNLKGYSCIEYFNQPFLEGIKILDCWENVDIVFLDGGDEKPNGLPKLEIADYKLDYNISENVQSFKFLETKIKIGAYVVCHDWIVDIGRGNFIKRYLENTGYNGWNVVSSIDCTDTGMAILKKI